MSEFLYSRGGKDFEKKNVSFFSIFFFRFDFGFKIEKEEVTEIVCTTNNFGEIFKQFLKMLKNRFVWNDILIILHKNVLVLSQSADAI